MQHHGAMADFYDELEFPSKAEYLDQYQGYQVDIAHWKPLVEDFRKVFRKVYARRDAAVLLVHGPQGSGKSMLSKRLAEDYERTRKGATSPDLKNNLWHVLVSKDEADESTIREVTAEVKLVEIDDRETNWLGELRSFAVKDDSRVRVFLCDDAHNDSMVRPWTDLPAKDFYEAKQAGPDALVGNLAERLNDACRHDFKRSIFVMLSNDKKWIEGLRDKLRLSFKELVVELSVPIPEPKTLERIVRTNTNRLNRVSYWYSLDAARAERRKEVRRVLVAGSGFTASFHAVSESLDSGSRRQGRPGNVNVITLVTLGTEFAAVEGFLNDREITTDVIHDRAPRHIGAWDMRGQWASKIVRRPDRDFLRRARMLESEFMLRWVSLDMVALHALMASPSANDLGARLLDFIRLRPSIGATSETKVEWRKQCVALDDGLDAAGFPSDAIDKQGEEMKHLGSRRSTLYEPVLRARLGASKKYGRGFAVYPALRPDIIVDDAGSSGHGEYTVCALTEAVSDDEGSIADAIRRTGHSIEFTAFMRESLTGLEEYLKGKIEVYASMLDSV
jgi:hypothetical protein